MTEEITKNETHINYVPKDKKINNKAKEKEIINKLKENTFKQKIEYVSNHVGLCTLIFTILIGVSSVLFKGYVYVYTCGKYDYLGISHTYINISNENMLYEVFFSVTAVVIYILLNYLLFLILTSNKKRYIKVLQSLTLLFITATVIYAFIFWYYVISGQGSQVYRQLSWGFLKIYWESFFRTFLLNIIIYSLGFTVSMVYLMLKYLDKNERTIKDIKETILWHKIFSLPVLILLLITLVVYVLLFYNTGRKNALNQSEYKIIDDNHVVVHEDKTSFLISECIIDEKNNTLTIKKGIQKLINKEGVETELKAFDIVNIKDNQAKEQKIFPIISYENQGEIQHYVVISEDEKYSAYLCDVDEDTSTLTIKTQFHKYFDPLDVTPIPVEFEQIKRDTKPYSPTQLVLA